MEALAIYLNDHLAGATLGMDLARRAAASNEGNAYGEELTSLAREIEQDRESLLKVMDELGLSRDFLKIGGAWAGEKLGRLKLNGSLFSYSSLSRLTELEGLYLGITGKLALWENLLRSGPRISSVDLAELRERALAQRSRLEELRGRAAAEAL